MASVPSFRKGNRGIFGLIMRTTTTPGTLSTRISTRLSPLTTNCASPPANDLIAPLTSCGGRIVTVSLSERSRRIGSIDLADSTRYFERASRLTMAFRVKAGTPLRSMSIEVAVDEDGGGADGAACASRGGSNTLEKRMEEATNADVTAVMIGRVISSRGWKRWLSSSKVAWMDEFRFPTDDTSRRWSNNFPDGRVNAKHVIEEAAMAMAASAMDGKDGMVNLLRVYGYFQRCDNNMFKAVQTFSKQQQIWHFQ
mmetsp:Transcript_14844/g.31706  ORF Transcript_14844/g.31706 Transcript_14844/m.31706 type:complete len:254 (+) Transcript_14844:947-1708(+)